jgi:hypothetical protein
MDQNDFLVTADLYASKEKRLINMVIDTIGYYAFSFIIGLLLGVLSF